MDIITRDQLSVLLDSIASSRTLIAPCVVEDVLLYQRVPSSAEVAWDFDLPVLSAKGALFPATERLMTIEKGGNDGEDNTIQLKLLEAIFESEQVIFGVRRVTPEDLRHWTRYSSRLNRSTPTMQGGVRKRHSLVSRAPKWVPPAFAPALVVRRTIGEVLI